MTVTRCNPAIPPIPDHRRRPDAIPVLIVIFRKIERQLKVSQGTANFTPHDAIYQDTVYTKYLLQRKTKGNTTQLFMSIEKRSKLRVPLDCEISFQAGPHHGAGRLVDVSSKAVAFRTEADLPHATFVQVSIPWPVRLGDCPLKLVAFGRVMNKRGEVVV
jgi:hypothetical protein